MKNITITLEPEVVRWVRIKAAEQEMSVSRYVSELLKEKMVSAPKRWVAELGGLAHGAGCYSSFIVR